MKKNFTPLKHPIDELDRSAPYEVPDDQMERFGKLTPLQRLKWLDEARRFTLLATVF